MTVSSIFSKLIKTWWKSTYKATKLMIRSLRLSKKLMIRLQQTINKRSRIIQQYWWSKVLLSAKASFTPSLKKKIQRDLPKASNLRPAWWRSYFSNKMSKKTKKFYYKLSQLSDNHMETFKEISLKFQLKESPYITKNSKSEWE